jgi:hypothetical protein
MDPITGQNYSGVPQPGGEPTAPAPGQGGGGNELHEQFISSVPENLREYAQQLVPHWDKHVQGKFTEHANYRKQWEPYEELGLTQHQPEALQQALALQAAFNDQEQLPELYSQLGAYLEQNGLMGQNEQPNDFGGAYDTNDPLVQTVTQMQQQMQQVSQFMQSFQEQQAQAQAAQFVNSQLEQIKQANPGLTDADTDAICTFALRYDGQDAVQRGFADYQALMSRAEQGIFEKKSEAPPPANSGGSASTKPEAIVSFADAAAAARERLTQSRQ